MKNTIAIHTENIDQEDALKAFAKALKIKFEVAKESPYDPEFVAMIKQSEKEFEDGDYTSVKKEDLKNFLGLQLEKHSKITKIPS